MKVKNQLQLRQNDLKMEDLKIQQGIDERKAEALEQEKALLKAREDALRPLEDQRRLLRAKLDGNEEEVRLQIEAANIARDIANLDESEVLQILQKNEALQKQVETMEQLKQQYQEIATGIASAFTNAFRSVIDGSKGVQEAFSNMMKDIADTFLDQAMRMIATAIKMKVLGILQNAFTPSPATPAPGPFFPLGQGF